MLELSRRIQSSPGHGEGEEEMEMGKLREILEDLQAQNTMLQDELTLLRNVKGELEAELERTKEEFQVEREELEFKVNELQLNRESTTGDVCGQPEVPVNFQHQETDEKPVEESKEAVISIKDQNELKLDEQQKLIQDLKAQCEALTRERDSILAEYHHTRDVLQGFETELGEKTKDFVVQYKAMKEQGAIAIQELQDKIQLLSQERDELVVQVREVTEEKKAILEKLQEMKLKVETFPNEEKKLQASIEEQTALALDLRHSLEELTRQKEDIISQLNTQEYTNEDLKRMVKNVNEERDKIQSQLQLKEEEIQRLHSEKAKETETLLEEKEKELNTLKMEKEDRADGLNKEMEVLQQTIEGLKAENNHLGQKLGEALSQLVQVEEEKVLSGSKLSALEAQLEKEISEKSLLQAKLISLSEEAAKARETITTLEQNHSEVMRNSTEEVVECRTRIQELETERNLLRSSLEEAKEEVSMTVQKELQTYISDLENERNLLQTSLEDVMKDVEGLQKDLQDMKAINEKVNEENQTLQAQVSLLTEEKEGHQQEQMEKEYKEELTEKETLVSQLRDEITALQVSHMWKINLCINEHNGTQFSFFLFLIKVCKPLFCGKC